MKEKTLKKLEVLQVARQADPSFRSGSLEPDDPEQMMSFADAKQVAGLYGFAAPVAIGFGMFAVVDIITPEVALRILQGHNERNRNEKVAHIERMSRDIDQEYWKLNHHGIALDEVGDLLDGQHRLAACAASGKPIRSMIFIYAGRGVATTLDCGIPRDFKDQLAIKGDNSLNNTSQAILRLFLSTRDGRNKHSSSELEELLPHVKESIDWALANMPTFSRGIGRCGVLGAIAAASRYVDRSRLQRFCEVLASRAADAARPEEATVIALLHHIDKQKSQKNNGSAVRKDDYTRTQRAIQAFIAGEVLKYIRPTSEVIYPIEFGDVTSAPVKRHFDRNVKREVVAAGV